MKIRLLPFVVIGCCFMLRAEVPAKMCESLLPFVYTVKINNSQKKATASGFFVSEHTFATAGHIHRNATAADVAVTRIHKQIGSIVTSVNPVSDPPLAFSRTYDVLILNASQPASASFVAPLAKPETFNARNMRPIGTVVYGFRLRNNPVDVEGRITGSAVTGPPPGVSLMIVKASDGGPFLVSGSSGSPLFDVDGQTIGMVSAAQIRNLNWNGQERHLLLW